MVTALPPVTGFRGSAPGRLAPQPPSGGSVAEDRAHRFARGHRVAWRRGLPRRRPRTVRGDGGEPGAHGRTAAEAIDSDVIPMPTSAQASSGSAAASPHTPTGLPTCFPASAVIAISCSTAGCQASVRWARSVAIRSAAIVYCVRSLVPMRQEVDDLEHPVGVQRGARDLDHHPGLQPPLADLRGELARPRRRWPPSAPSPRSRSRCSRRPARSRRAGAPSGPGCRRPAAARGRRARGSPRRSRVANAIGLSEPASRVRTTT